jgi:aminoglycoside phosphotransferase (APT) family kinase protein
MPARGFARRPSVGDVEALPAVQAAIAAMLPGAHIVGVRELPGGVSANVCQIDVETAEGGAQRYVFRQHLGDTFKDHDGNIAAKEFAVLQRLRWHGFPVPEALHLDQSTSAPFVLMEAVEGSTSVAESDLPQALVQMADFLTQLHALDPGDLGVVGLGVFEDPRPDLLRYLAPTASGEAVRSAVLGGELPLVGNRLTVIHGDYWPGNILWEDGRLAAVIDWEDCTISDPLADVACARVELLCQYGAGAMDDFTAHYLRSFSGRGGSLRLDSLPLWEVFVSAAALSSMADWGLEPAEERRRRTITEQFFERAAADLLRQGGGRS